MNYSWEVAKIIFYLSLVLGIIYLLANFLKKRFFNPARGLHMETIEQLYLGPKKSLKLVRVREVVLLLSITENETKLLKEWPESKFPAMIEKGNEEKSDFSHYLKKFLSQHRGDQDE
jgi:flagellar protein FliO/FliZ